MQDKDKLYDPARNNEQAPAPGMAAVSTHNPGEDEIEKAMDEQQEEGRQGNGELADSSKE